MEKIFQARQEQKRSWRSLKTAIESRRPDMNISNIKRRMETDPQRFEILFQVLKELNLCVINGKIVPGKYITLKNEFFPWKEFIHNEYPGVKFVIGPSAHPGNPYSLIAVPVSPESREVKCEIERPEWFHGFIHLGKWIAGGDLEQLVKLAEWNFLPL